MPDGRVLGLAKNKKCKMAEPSLTYQMAQEADLAKIDKAFDILFEETLHKMGDLTSYDN